MRTHFWIQFLKISFFSLFILTALIQHQWVNNDSSFRDHTWLLHGQKFFHFCLVMFFLFYLAFWRNFIVLINIYAIVIIHFPPLKTIYLNLIPKKQWFLTLQNFVQKWPKGPRGLKSKLSADIKLFEHMYGVTVYDTILTSWTTMC